MAPNWLIEVSVAMKRTSILQMFGAGLLGSVLVPGCETPDPRPASVYHRPPMPPASSHTDNKEVADLGSAAPATAPNAMESLPAPVFPPSEAESTAQAAETKEGIAKQADRAEAKPAMPPMAGPDSTPPVTQVAAVEAKPASSTGHAEDYSWLRGEVQYDHISKGWRLRYAGLDEYDRWGGAVILAADGSLDRLRDGQIVKVQGHLVESENRRGAPLYHADSIAVAETVNRYSMP